METRILICRRAAADARTHGSFADSDGSKPCPAQWKLHEQAAWHTPRRDTTRPRRVVPDVKQPPLTCQ